MVNGCIIEFCTVHVVLGIVATGCVPLVVSILQAVEELLCIYRIRF